MPTRRLPARSDLRHLKHQARDLIHQQPTATLDLCQRIREFHPRFGEASDDEIRRARFSLADAHLTIAREYGFPSWPRLKAFVEASERPSLDQPHHERIADPVFREAVALVDEGDVEGLRGHLDRHPGLVSARVVFDGGNYFRDPTLLEFVAENPIRRGVLPPTIIEVARAILDAGAKHDRRAIDSTLSLVCSGQVSRECGVQQGLIDLLCDAGADPDGAMLPALGHGEFAAVEALVARGARLDLVVAAATGQVDAARETLAMADAGARHRALALAAQHGHADVVSLLLDAGESPDRYNPVGSHAHSTPLHQAALAGHLDVVRLLVDRGARLDIRDIHHGGTPVEWAEHGGRQAVVDELRRRRGRQAMEDADAGESDMNDERPPVRVYSGPMLAMVMHLKQVLAMSGIDGDVRGEYRGAGLGDIPVMEAWPELWVDAAHAGEAERIVREALASSETPPVDVPTRTCPTCHEQVEAQFGVCWNCGTTLEDA